MNAEVEKFSAVTQEHSMGCAVACVAARCGISYKQALQLFAADSYAWTRGYYCSEVVAALGGAELEYDYAEFLPEAHSGYLEIPGTIIFIEPGESYPFGHFFLRTDRGWMNPWANFPEMCPPTSRIEEKLGGRISYVVHERIR